MTLRAKGEPEVRPETFDPGLAPAILAVGAGGHVTRSRLQSVSGSVRSSWLGGGAVRRTTRALLRQSVVGVERAVGDCYDHYCD